MTERNVTVRLRLVARHYSMGATEAERMTRRLAASQRDLAGASRQAGDELDRTSRRAEQAGRRSHRAMLYTAAGVAAVGAAGGGLKLLPGLLTATAAAAATLPPLLTGTAATAGVLITSLKGVGKASGEVLKSDDPFAGLGHNARALVAEVKRLQPEMSEFRLGLQDRALDNAARNLNMLATRGLPQVRGELNLLATDWDEAFSQITAAVTDRHFTGAFRTAARGADWFFDMFNARIPATVRAIGTLISSADPLARAFGQSLINLIDRFNARVERAARSGSLEEFFGRGARGASAFFDIVGGVLDLIGVVTREVGKQNGTLADTAASLDAYLASGRAAGDVAGIVRTLTTAYEGLKDVTGPLGAILRDAVADPATADAVKMMFDVMAAGTQVLQVIFNLFQALPDPMQSLILTGIALGLVVGKLTKGLGAMQIAAGRAATSLAATGTAGTRAGRGLNAAAAGLGKAATALVALQAAGIVLDQWDGSAADMDALARSIEAYATRGKLGGEVTRLFGDDLDRMGQAARGASDHWFPKLGRSLEEIFPPAKNLTELWAGGSFTGDAERFRALDAALSQYAQTTGDLATVQDLWGQALAASGVDVDQLVKLLPASYAELERLQAAAHAGAGGMQAQSERAKLLGGSFREAALAGKDLAATMDLINGKNVTAVEGQIKLEAAYDAAKETADKYGRVTKKNTHEINLGTEAGRASMEALIGIQQAATAAADAEVKRTGNTAAGIPILNAARERFVELATRMTGSATAARSLADEIFAIPNKDVKIRTDSEIAVDKLRKIGYTIKQLPNGKYVIVDAKTDEARRRIKETQKALDRINSKTITITVRQVLPSGDIRIGRGGSGGTISQQATGGVSVPYGRPIAAAMGLVRPDIYAPHDPPLYQFAERETGGELFLPRRGIDRERGRALLAVGASWYGGMFVPMRAGGIRAAASGLVNVAPATQSGPDRASRLDYAEAYLRARDAVASLNAALKENGRSFSTATAKGRENRAAVYSAIRAAEEAARVKFAETGSVKAANKEYDAHIARLRATLKQQKVNSKTINELLKLAQRPDFTTPPPPPANSAGNIAAARATIAANTGLGELADRLSLNRAGVDVDTQHGRDNLSAILDFLGLAESAAQAVFGQTGSSSKATAAYDAYIKQLRDQLSKSGYSADVINNLINTYGKITLQPNARGGVYMAAVGGLGMLSGARIYQQPMYGWAEKGTGGELFLPRLGEQQRGERLLAVGAGWYGGRYVPRGGDGGGATTYNNSLTVNGAGSNLSIAELRGLLRQMETEARVGRRK